jgi:hypothetical protein
MAVEQLDRVKAEKDEAYRNFWRFRCQTDLLFLAHMLGYDKMMERVHRPAIAECCILKNPDKSLKEQSKIKEYVHLDPRGTYKSTLSMTDAVQWIICFPNVRICILTATKDLCEALAGEITDHFVSAPGADKTDFQFLFPEFLIAPSTKRVGQYTAPCRTKNWKEKTVMAFSIEKTMSGWHFDVGLIDDAVDTQNSSTKPGIEKVKKNYRINRKTFMPWAYKCFKGTRYDPFDLYGDRIEKAKPGKIKILSRSAFQFKDDPTRRLERGDFPDEKDIILLFPELLSYEFLKDEFEDDYSTFMTQYMNDAHGDNDIVFTAEQILAASVQAEDVPITGNTFVAWKLGYGEKAATQYAAGVAGVMDGGRMYIVDADRGKFRPSSLAHKIVEMAKRNGVRQVSIEDTPGARLAEAAILNYGLVSKWQISIQWIEYQEDAGVRDMRMKSTEPLVATRRLIFSDGLKIWKELKRQFYTYGMVEETDLPDVISRICEKLPKSIAVQEEDTEQDLAWELAKQQDKYEMTHGLGRYAEAEPIVEEKPYAPPTNSYGLDEMIPGLNG